MSISGSLEDLSAIDILQLLHVSGKTGRLDFASNGQEASIVFNNGAIVAVTNPLASINIGLILFELGMVKPDREIFDHVVADLGIAGSAVLFLDDNQLNVAAARKAGLNAELAKGIEAAREALVSYRLIAA